MLIHPSVAYAHLLLERREERGKEKEYYERILTGQCKDSLRLLP